MTMGMQSKRTAPGVCWIGALALSLLVGCNQGDTATITTKTGIDLTGYDCDSVAVDVYVDGELSQHFVRTIYQAQGNKIRWDIEAPEQSSIKVDARIWYQRRVVATQIYAWISGQMPVDPISGMPVPAPIVAPSIYFKDTIRAYKDGSTSIRIPIWAFAGSLDGSAQITALEWKAPNVSSWLQWGGLGSGKTADSTYFEFDCSSMEVGPYLAAVKVQDASGRTFEYPQVLEVLDVTPTITDARDGHSYRWRTIGRRDWMIDNLNYVGDSTLQANSFCYDGQDSNCARYGRLYTWSAMKMGPTLNYQGICPDGWAIPQEAPMHELIFLAGQTEHPAQALMADSLWVDNRIDSNQMVFLGTDEIGFAALPAGTHDYYGFQGLGLSSDFWSWKSSIQAGYGYSLKLGSGLGMIDYVQGDFSTARSIRCVRQGIIPGDD